MTCLVLYLGLEYLRGRFLTHVLLHDHDPLRTCHDLLL